MGMFDDVTCELPIPGEPKPKRLSFQTKDFDCYLDRYTIRADGTLWRDAGDWRTGQVPFHGLLRFYTFESEGPSAAPGMWFEYEAKFTDGKCAGVECVEIHRSHFGVIEPEVLYSRAPPASESQS
jgi:hypothetical protein